MTDTATDMSFRLTSKISRVIMTTDIPLANACSVTINRDSDDPASTPNIITIIRQSIQSRRAVSISVYSPLAPKDSV